MMLAIKNLFHQQRSLSLAELAHGLNASMDLTRDMVNLYIKKGRIRICSAQCQTSCQGCLVKNVERYEWLG